MVIKQDPTTGLYCREDGAVLLPPTGHKFRKFRWTFGSSSGNGYKQIWFHGKHCSVHRLVCSAFHGLAPEGKSQVDHINRTRYDNRPENLHWVDRSENSTNRDYVDESVEKFGVRFINDPKAYAKAHNQVYYEAHREETKARQKFRYAAKKAAGFVLRVINGKQRWIQKELV